MTKNWIKKILTFFTFVLTIFVLASCGEVIPSGNKNANSEGRYIVHFEAIAATCDSEGREEFWYDMDSREYFSDADAKNKIDGPVAIQALGHSYSVSYTWSSDNSTCTAAKACTVCGNIELSETVTATRTVDVEPTATEAGSATYVATFTTQGFEAQTKTGVIPALGDLTNYGSESEPLTVTEALAIAQAQCLSHGDYSLQQAWVRGTAKTSPVINEAYFGSFELTDGTSTLIIYSSNKSETCDELYQNDTVTIHGYLEKFSGNFEIATKTVSDDEKYQPEALNRVAGQGSVTITQSNGGTLEASAATGTNGTTFTITATPNEEFAVLNVKANGVELEKNTDGTYTAKFAGSVAITGTFQDLNAVESKVASYDFSAVTETTSLEVPGEGKEHAGEDLLKAFFEENAATTGGLSNVVLETSNVSKIFKGDSSGTAGNLGLKTGISSAQGTFHLRTNTAITKVVVSGFGWTATDKMALNGEEAIFGVGHSAEEPVELTFLLPGVKNLEFSFNKRVIIQKIELYTSSYTVRFYSEDGTTEYEDFRQILAAGSLLDPHDEQDAPTKAQDVEHTYTFAGWATEVGGEALDNLPAVSASAKYYAVFASAPREYTITFVDNDGTTVLEAKPVAYGTVPAFTGTTEPTKASDEEYNYSFDGWALTLGGDKVDALPAVSGAATYYPHFLAVSKDFASVTWYNWDGTNSTQLEVIPVEKGNVAVAPQNNPTRGSDANNHYFFAGWSLTAGGEALAELPVISEDTASFYAVYASEAHDWTPVEYEWELDHSSCTASRFCLECDREESEEVSSTSVETPAGFENDEYTTYTATFTNAAFEEQVDVVTVPNTQYTITAINTINATTGDDEINVIGKILAKNGSNGILIDDGTAGIYVYKSGLFANYNVGDIIGVQAKVSAYYKGLQLAPSGATKVVLLTNTTIEATSTAHSLTGATISGYLTLSTLPTDTLISLNGVGVVSQGSNYFVLYYDGANMETTNNMAGGIEVGFVYNLEGYIYGVYSNTYVTFMVTNATKVAAISAEDVEITKGLTATLAPETGTLEDTYTYASASVAIATVSETGVITGVEAGTTTITITSNTYKITKTINVTVNYATTTAIDIIEGENNQSGSVGIGSELQLVINPTPANGNPSVIWSSSDEDKATVDNNGLVLGVAAGEVTITATSTVDGTLTDTFVVTVTAPIAVEGLTITAEDNATSVAATETLQLFATPTPSNAPASVIWSSSDETKATVDADGLVTGVAVGTVEIIATSTVDSNISQTYVLTVVYAYKLATSIKVGDKVNLVCTSYNVNLTAISTTSTKYGMQGAYTLGDEPSILLTVVAGNADGTYAFQMSDGKYLTWTSGNSLNANATMSDNTSWTVSFSGTDATITNYADATRVIKYNNSSPRFACYTSGQNIIQLVIRLG